MSKLNIVYIGPKPQKRITVSGKRFIFPQGKPVAIDDEIAYNLLEFTGVFAEEKDAADAMKAISDAAEKEAKRKAAIAKEQEKQAEEESWVVLVDGEEKDISKYTIAKLKTIIVAEELAVETDNVELKDLREAVRSALRAKNSAPVEA